MSLPFLPPHDMTLGMIKAHAMQRGHLGLILADIETRYVVQFLHILSLTRAEAEAFYPERRADPYVIESLFLSPVCFFVVSPHPFVGYSGHIVEDFRGFVGRARPDAMERTRYPEKETHGISRDDNSRHCKNRYRPGTLRHKYGDREPYNAVHSSADAEDFAREYGLLREMIARRFAS